MPQNTRKNRVLCIARTGGKHTTIVVSLVFSSIAFCVCLHVYYYVRFSVCQSAVTMTTPRDCACVHIVYKRRATPNIFAALVLVVVHALVHEDVRATLMV